MFKPLVDFFRQGTCLPDSPFCSPAVLKREAELAAQDLTPCERGGLCGKRVPDLAKTKREEVWRRALDAVTNSQTSKLAELLREAADAHHNYEEAHHVKHNVNEWSNWYAKYLLGEEV